MNAFPNSGAFKEDWYFDGIFSISGADPFAQPFVRISSTDLDVPGSGNTVTVGLSGTGGYNRLGPFEILVPWRLGYQDTYELKMDTQVLCSFGVPCSESVNFIGTATLGGFQVLDDNLQPITVPFTLESDSGIDYLALTPPTGNVPEPSSFGLGMFSLAGILAFRRPTIGSYK